MCDKCQSYRHEIYKLRDENLALNRRVQVAQLEIDALLTQRNELRFYTIEQVATALQIDRSKVERDIRGGKLSYYQTGKGGAIRVSHNALMAYIVAATTVALEICEC